MPSNADVLSSPFEHATGQNPRTIPWIGTVGLPDGGVSCLLSASTLNLTTLNLHGFPITDMLYTRYRYTSFPLVTWHFPTENYVVGKLKAEVCAIIISNRYSSPSSGPPGYLQLPGGISARLATGFTSRPTKDLTNSLQLAAETEHQSETNRTLPFQDSHGCRLHYAVLWACQTLVVHVFRCLRFKSTSTLQNDSKGTWNPKCFDARTHPPLPSPR